MRSIGKVISLSGLLVLFACAPPRQAGATELSGVVHPAGASITLASESGEKASATTDPGGRYAFEALPDGEYVLQASAQGYASDTFKIRISGGRSVEQNARLLFISRIDGIDWQKRVIRARGTGRYPTDSTNRPAAREMAKRAALSDAERNLLWIVEQIKVGPNQRLMSLIAGSYIVRIKGYLQGYRVVGERETGSGVEMELQLPLTGPEGLTRIISN